MHSSVQSGTIYNSKTWKQPVSINRGMDEEDMLHIYHGIFLSHKKEWNDAICNNMQITQILSY